MSDDIDEAFRVELRSARASEDLVSRTGIDDLLFTRLSFEQRRQHDRSRGEVDPRRERFRANTDREQLLLEEVLDDPLVLGQDPRVMHADAAHQ